MKNYQIGTEVAIINQAHPKKGYTGRIKATFPGSDAYEVEIYSFDSTEHGNSYMLAGTDIEIRFKTNDKEELQAIHVLKKCGWKLLATNLLTK